MFFKLRPELSQTPAWPEPDAEKWLESPVGRSRRRIDNMNGPLPQPWSCFDLIIYNLPTSNPIRGVNIPLKRAEQAPNPTAEFRMTVGNNSAV
jgi:hypothetical protein